jgi:hypothetical protein
MIKFLVASLFLILFVAETSNATKPCSPPDKQWFVDNIVKKSELVVYAKIKDYSASISNVFGAKWTSIEVLQVLKGNFDSQKELTIQDWQSHDDPLYVWEKDSYVVLWLTKNDGKYYITDLSWNYCVPSVWDADDAETSYNMLSGARVTLKGIKDMIAEEAAK